MKIFRVGVTYGELRSSGYPSFSNTRHEVSLTAVLSDGECASDAAKRLESYAKQEVKRRFGDASPVELNDMDTPYVKNQVGGEK